MLSENKKLMEQYSYKSLLELVEYEKVRENISIQIVDSKSGQKTIQVNDKGSIQMIHSKYDPELEAEKFISQFKGIENEYEHVMFYGLGLGYHIKTFMAAHPRFTFSIYEPEIEIFYQFLKHFQLRELPLDRLTDVLIETSKEKGKQFINEKIHNMQGRILVITLPSYERVFKERYLTFSEELKKAVKTKRQDHYVNMNFSARWTLNSLVNLPTTLQTPNILKGFNSFFKDKPLIIVSAGPSLEDEYENLRYIKENKLAYIFAVGSANRALITNNILPDAICTYDPQGHNYVVFSTMSEKGIDSVPMIYGSSVGFETLKTYKGPKMHMVIDQDTVTPYYVKKEVINQENTIQDSPTIAAIAYQLAVKLGSNPIIFVGQNLAFKNNQYYSNDVSYNNDTRVSEVLEKDRIGLMQIPDVYGNQIETNLSFNNMRENLELYISQYCEHEVLNTTKGGADIKGAKFIPLEELINRRLKQPVVIDKWYETPKNVYDQLEISNKIEQMERSIFNFNVIYSEIIEIIDKLKSNITHKKEKSTLDNIINFDKKIKKMMQTDFYITFIQSINKEFYQALSMKAAFIRKQTDTLQKGQLIIDSFFPYLLRCRAICDQLLGSIYKVHELISNKDLNYKYYASDCGVFQLYGKWTRVSIGPGEKIDFKVNQYETDQKGSSIKFRFTGTTLKIFGSANRAVTGKISIRIDGKSEVIKLKHNKQTKDYKQLIIFKKGLAERLHEVELKILDDNLNFTFYGAEIDKKSRLLHIDEVTDFDNLQIGKRIRVHYKAEYNKLGVFKNFGQETNEFIPINSTSYPDGDFYFVMVDDNKCIADRNLQNYLSWDVLKDEGVASKRGLKINNINNREVMIRLLTGGKNEFDENNEWVKYLNEKSLLDNEWNLMKNQLVWCLDVFKEESKAVIRGCLHLNNTKIGSDINSFGVIDKSIVGKVYFRPVLIL